jgi:signal transduction histidine kinase
MVLPLLAKAQPFTPDPDWKFDNFSSQNHFTSRQILSIAVDKQGYIWTSGTGIQRFDGFRTIGFKSANPAPRSIKDDYAHVTADNNGRIWASSGGLCYYDDASGKFIYAQPRDNKHPITYAYAFFMQKNYLWFVCDYGLAKIDVHTFNISFTSLTGIVDPLCTYLVDKNTLLISSRQKVYIYNIEKDTYTANTLTYNNSLVKVFSVAKRGDNVYLGTTRGLFMLKNLKDITLLSDETKELEIDDMLFLPDDKDQKYLFLATDGKGVMVYNTVIKKVEFTYVHDDNNPFSLSCNIIIKLFIDKTGRLWMGTEVGISVLSRYSQQCKIRYINKSNTDERSILKIRMDESQNSKVWMAVENHGMVCLDWKTKKVEKTYNTSPEMQRIVDFAQISKDRWLLANQKKIMEWSPAKGILSEIRLPIADSLYLGYYIRKIIVVDSQTYFITTNKGLFKFNLRARAITIAAKNNKVDKNYVYAYDLLNGFYDDGMLWIASRNGLFNYNTSTGTVNIYNHEKISNYFLNDACDAGNKQIVCAERKGLLVFDKTTKTFKAIKAIGNLRVAECLGVISKGNTIWVGTQAGILSYDLKTHTSMKIENGNSPLEIVPRSGFAIIDDEIAIGFKNSYAYFKLGQKNNVMVSNPVIESFSVNNQPLLNQYSNPRLRFKYSDNSINIGFTAFLYSNPDDINFRYRLKGAETGWQYPEDQRNANYAQLQPGSYTFYVQSGVKNGGWNNHLALVSFTITPPFWVTWWFRALIVTLIASILYQLYQYKIRHIKDIESIRQNIASDFHDDLGSTLSSISIFSEVAVQKTDTDLAGAKTMVGDIGVRARAMIHSMNDMVWTIKPENDNLHKLLQRMEEFSYPVAEAKEIQLVFLMDENLYNIKTDMVRRKNLFLIFKEAFNNAVKYSNAGSIQVQFKLNHNKVLVMRVTDNGCGFKYESRRPGNGLANMQKRAAEIKGKLTVSTAPGKGTEINVICKIA